MAVAKDLRRHGTNKIHGVILILKRIIESVPEVYSLSKDVTAYKISTRHLLYLDFFLYSLRNKFEFLLLLHLESDDSAQVAHATIGIDFQSKTMCLEAAVNEALKRLRDIYSNNHFRKIAKNLYEYPGVAREKSLVQIRMGLVAFLTVNINIKMKSKNETTEKLRIDWAGRDSLSFLQSKFYNISASDSHNLSCELSASDSHNLSCDLSAVSLPQTLITSLVNSPALQDQHKHSQ
ncbi:hypothetical protein YC2023_014246 [Brassica napus]